MDQNARCNGGDDVHQALGLCRPEGRLQTRSYDDKEGVKRYVTEVVAENVVFARWGRKRQR